MWSLPALADVNVSFKFRPTRATVAAWAVFPLKACGWAELEVKTWLRHMRVVSTSTIMESLVVKAQGGHYVATRASG